MVRRLRALPRLAIVCTVVAAPLIGLGWLFWGASGALTAFVIAVVAQFLAWSISRPVLLRMSESAVTNSDSHPHLVSTVERLATTAGVTVPRVAISRLRTPNAFAAATPGGGIVGVTTGLLDMLDGAELDAVIAHEVAHLARGDRAAATVAALFAALPGELAARSGSELFYDVPFRRSYHRVWGGRYLRPLRDGLALCTVPLSAILVRASVPCAAEIQADRDAVRLTGDRTAMINALRKLNALAGRVATPVNPALAHMLVIHPFSERLLGRIFNTHPTLAVRIAEIERIQE